MGLTIHYSLKSREPDALAIVTAMRQLALELPLDYVGDVITLTGQECDFKARRAELQDGNDANESLFWLLIQAREHIKCPWNKRMSTDVLPSQIIAFSTWPGDGCEAANFGLCLYPEFIDWEYDPKEDQRFVTLGEKGWQRFDWKKWDRHCKRNGLKDSWPEQHKKMRAVRTMLKGWQWSSFCKTQFASEPECGGTTNFLRCHISVITLLDRIAKLPGLRVHINDEGSYGPHSCCVDCNAAKRAYRRHKGHYSPAMLAREIGETDVSSMADMEFKGRKNKDVTLFLTAMQQLAKEVGHAAH